MRLRAVLTLLLVAGCAPEPQAPPAVVAPAVAAPVSTPVAPAPTAVAAEMPTQSPPGAASAVPHRATVADARVFVEYARYWDRPEDDRSSELYRRLKKSAPDWATFQKAVPAGSADRTLILHYLDQFEQAGSLMRAGALHPDLYFAMWYDAGSNWHTASPWIAGLRSESGQPDLYERFEWLAHRAHDWSEAREKAPLVPTPIDLSLPATSEQVDLFYDFASLWRGPRDVDADRFVEQLSHKASDLATFERLAARGTHEYTMFDRVYCEIEQASVLVQQGLLRADLAIQIRSAARWWEIGKAWFLGMRERDPHAHEDAEWLARREMELRAAKTASR